MNDGKCQQREFKVWRWPYATGRRQQDGTEDMARDQPVVADDDGERLAMAVSEPPQSVQVISLLGPAAAAILLIVWWLFASRAGGKEKVGGLLGLGVVAGLIFLLLHPTMRVLPAIVFFVPIGVAAFALPLVILARSPMRRVPCAILLSLVGFGFWGLLQFGGTSGMFAFDFDWRWNPSAEQRYLASLSERSGASADTILLEAKVSEPITSESAQWPGFRGAIARGNMLADFGDPLLDPAASTKRHVAFNTRPKHAGQRLGNRAGNDTGDHNSNAFGRIFARPQPRFTSEHHRQGYNK